MLFRGDADYIKSEILRIAKGKDISRRWKRARGLICYVEKLINQVIPSGFESNLYGIAWGGSRIFRLKKAAKLGIDMDEEYFKIIEWEES